MLSTLLPGIAFLLFLAGMFTYVSHADQTSFDVWKSAAQVWNRVAAAVMSLLQAQRSLVEILVLLAIVLYICLLPRVIHRS